MALKKDETEVIGSSKKQDSDDDDEENEPPQGKDLQGMI